MPTPAPAPGKVPFYATAEDWIRAEWNWVRGSIALHPYISVAVAMFVGNMVGVFLRF